MEQELFISHYVEKTTCLGPYGRNAVWVHGCCFSCEGCIADLQYSQPFKIGTLRLAEILRAVPGTEGVTISGGEPFLQADALVEFLEALMADRDCGVIVYTGFRYEELRARSGEASIGKLLELTDILIDGPYIAALDDGKPYRGSSNQRILQLSGRYAGVFDSYYLTEGRKMEINVSRNGTVLVGVPSKDGLEAWKRMQTEGGYLRHANRADKGSR